MVQKTFANAEHHYENDVLHNDSGPAIIYTGGAQNGVKIWCYKGQIHRDGGPAVEYPNGGKEYYRHGKWRRLDGPAVDGAGVLPDEWWIDGQRYTEADWRIKTGGTITGLTPVTGPDLQYPHNPFVEPTETPIQCDHPEHARYPERNGKTGCYKCSAIFD